MRTLLQCVSWCMLLGTIIPPLLFLLGTLPLDQCQGIMLIATLIWFVVTPFWMGRETCEGSTRG